MSKYFLLSYTDRLYDILDDIGDKVAEKLMRIESDPSLSNEIGVELVDKSPQDWSFEVKIGGKWQAWKIGRFVRYFTGTTFTDAEIKSFSEKYNILKSGKKLPEEGEIEGYRSVKVEIPSFVWNPKDVRSTFLSLVTETYPHGHEEEVVPLISKIGLKKDEYGNYYKIVGKSETMFTSHLDTADRQKSKVTVYSENRGNQEIFTSDGTTILGADDKSGVAVMLYMISHNVPGVYYFFIGEERGGIGSGMVSSSFEKTEHLKGIKRCISFDRRNYYSVITRQLGEECCSEVFAQALADQYNSLGMSLKLDPTGVYTDSASFIGQIPECTNISVGYFDEHTTRESQNITYLEKLAKASVSVKWEELPVVKKVDLDDDIIFKYGKFINDFKQVAFNMNCKIAGERGRAFVKLEFDQTDVDLVVDDLLSLGFLFEEHRINPPVTFDDDIVKFELEKNKGYYRKYLDNYNIFSESMNTFDDYEEFDDYEDFDDYADYTQYDDEMGGEDEKESEMGELSYWIRQMFKSNKIYCDVEYENFDLIVYIFPSRRENLENIIKIFEVVDRITKDLLTTYNAEVDLYQNKQKDPILKFTFSHGVDYMEEEDEEKDLPF